jgi:type II secretory pathway pseudopilin PulG
MVARVSPASAWRARCERGTTLLETVIAVALIGLATLAAVSLLAAQPRAAERLAAQHELLRVAEATIESVRSGALPLLSGPVESPIPTSRPVRVSLEVRDLDPAGLREVTVTAVTRLREQRVERGLASLIWRRP